MKLKFTIWRKQISVKHGYTKYILLHALDSES